jgi:hypothetical protein
MSFKEYIIEDTNPAINKMVNKLIKWFKKEYSQAFKNDYKIESKVISSTQAEVTLYFDRFLSDNKHDKAEFELAQSDLVYGGTNIAEAIKVEVTDSQYNGEIAMSLIKRGKTIDCDSLLSQLTVTLTFPINLKR